MVFYVHERSLKAQWDLKAYLNAAQSIHAGVNPYPLEDENALVHITNLTVYVYPPLLARALSPFMDLPQSILKIGWFLLQCVAFESLYWLGLRLVGKPFERVTWLFYHALALLYDGVYTDLRAGNTALMEASVLTAWAVLHLERPFLSGLLLGGLLAVKPLVIFVSIWDLVRGRWKALLAAAGTTAVLYGVMYFDHGLFQSYQTFLDSNTFQRIMDEHTVGIFNSATVSVGFRLFTEQTMFKPVLICPPLAYLYTFLVPIVVWLAAFSAWRRMDEAGIPSEEQNRLGLYLLLPTVLLTIPRVADYTLVWLLIPLFFGGWEAWERRIWPVFCLYSAAALVGNLPVHPAKLVEVTYSYHLMHYRYVSLILFWWAGWWLIRRRTRPVNLIIDS